MGIDLLSISAHKMYGPKGVGALYVRKRNTRVRLDPIQDGGGHEGGLRSGTLPVPLIVGLGKAAALCANEMEVEAVHIRKLRDRLQEGIFKNLDHVYLNGDPERRLPGNLNVSFAYVESEELIQALGEIAVSSSAACSSAKIEPSHVLRALGLSEVLAHGAIRFGLGRFNTEEEVDTTVNLLVKSVRHLRTMSPIYETITKED
jgi:cysteine desulfurase